jgi:hypothetical protein
VLLPESLRKKQRASGKSRESPEKIQRLEKYGRVSGKNKEPAFFREALKQCFRGFIF